MGFEIREGGLDDARVIALVTHHRATASAQTAICSAHSLAVDALRDPDVRFFACWDGDDLLGIGALRMLAPGWAEIKTMHTAETARRRGIGRAMLRHLIQVARESGVRRLNLETGAWPYFEPSHALYRGEGFVPCEAFGDYAPDPNSLFFELTLQPAGVN